MKQQNPSTNTAPRPPVGLPLPKDPNASAFAVPEWAEWLNIGELARQLDVTTRTIRFYESRGLITPQRGSAGARVYGRRDRARLMLILRGKRLGFTLKEIAEFLDLYDAGPERQARHFLSKVDEATSRLQRKMADIEETLSELTAIRDQCIAAMPLTDPENPRQDAAE